METKKPKVLVVDDEHVIADTLAIILNQHGFDALAVYTGTGAVEQARNLHPDLIISDVIMPDMDGIEAAIHIRAFLPELQNSSFFRAGGHGRPAGERTRPGPRVRNPGQARSSAGPAGKAERIEIISGMGRSLADSEAFVWKIQPGNKIQVGAVLTAAKMH